jgi:hypothetical protein
MDRDSSSLADQHKWEKYANVSVLDKESVEVDLFRLMTDSVAHIAGVVLMGEAFHKNNPGIIEDVWRFDSGFGGLLTGVPGVGKAKNEISHFSRSHRGSR